MANPEIPRPESPESGQLIRAASTLIASIGKLARAVDVDVSGVIERLRRVADRIRPADPNLSLMVGAFQRLSDGLELFASAADDSRFFNPVTERVIFESNLRAVSELLDQLEREQAAPEA